MPSPSTLIVFFVALASYCALYRFVAGPLPDEPPSCRSRSRVPEQQPPSPYPFMFPYFTPGMP